MSAIKRGKLESWIGSDNMNADHLVSLLLDVLNGDYSVSEFKKDVKEHEK